MGNRNAELFKIFQSEVDLGEQEPDKRDSSGDEEEEEDRDESSPDEESGEEREESREESEEETPNEQATSPASEEEQAESTQAREEGAGGTSSSTGSDRDSSESGVSTPAGTATASSGTATGDSGPDTATPFAPPGKANDTAGFTQKKRGNEVTLSLTAMGAGLMGVLILLGGAYYMGYQEGMTAGEQSVRAGQNTGSSLSGSDSTDEQDEAGGSQDSTGQEEGSGNDRTGNGRSSGEGTNSSGGTDGNENSSTVGDVVESSRSSASESNREGEGTGASTGATYYSFRLIAYDASEDESAVQSYYENIRRRLEEQGVHMTGYYFSERENEWRVLAGVRDSEEEIAQYEDDLDEAINQIDITLHSDIIQIPADVAESIRSGQ